jgi:hypothetical protein
MIYQGENPSDEAVDAVVKNLRDMEEYVKNNNPQESSKIIDSLSRLQSKFQNIKSSNAGDLVSFGGVNVI